MRNTSTIKLLLFATILLSPLCMNAEAETRSQDTSPVTISPAFTNNPTISPIFTNNPTISPICDIKNKPTFNNYVSSLSYAVGMKIRDISIIWIEIIKKKVTKENYELLRDLIKEILWEHRYKIAGGTAVGSYSATSLLLLADYHYLSCNTAWSRWKPESTFEDLCAIPQKELARELLLTIGQRYYNEKNPTDLAHPLVKFLSNIDKEIKIIKRYIGTTKIIKRLHLITIFPTNDNKMAQTQRLLERALFIKHIFLSWLSDYNLTSNNKN